MKTTKPAFAVWRRSYEKVAEARAEMNAALKEAEAACKRLEQARMVERRSWLAHCEHYGFEP